MTHAHDVTVRLGDDQHDGRHMLAVSFDTHLILNIGLTSDDLDQFAAQVRQAACRVWEREHPSVGLRDDDESLVARAAGTAHAVAKAVRP